MQAYSNPKRESDPHALPDVEILEGYKYTCPEDGSVQPGFPDYYGVLDAQSIRCEECSGPMACLDTKIAYWYWDCFPGCLPDSEPFGPYDTEEAALAAAQEDAADDED